MREEKCSSKEEKTSQITTKKATKQNGEFGLSKLIRKKIHSEVARLQG